MLVGAIHPVKRHLQVGGLIFKPKPSFNLLTRSLRVFFSFTVEFCVVGIVVEGFFLYVPKKFSRPAI